MKTATSSDEVVNKLHAENDYSVTAVEDFTPPTQWTPGTTVEKKVSAVNTGNIDAFVKATITGDIVLTRNAGATPFADASEDELVEIAPDEVKTLQAGGKLVVAGAKDEIENAGVTVDMNTNLTEDGTSFEPTEPGYYIFARSTEEEGEEGNLVSVTYDGYYFDGDKYYRITIDNSNLSMYNVTALVNKTEKTLINADDLKYSVVDGDNVIVAKYVGNDPDGKENILFDLKLADDTLDNIDGNSHVSFYYNKLLKAGETSSQILDSVTLNNTVSSEAYIAMDYNLKVTVDSAQVVEDRTDNNKAVTAVNDMRWGKVATYASDDNVAWY